MYGLAPCYGVPLDMTVCCEFLLSTTYYSLLGHLNPPAYVWIALTMFYLYGTFLDLLTISFIVQCDGVKVFD